MKHIHCKLLILILIGSHPLYAQYTDIINSNRPGRSVSAYSVGKNVYQAELGGFYERRKHNGLLTENDQYGVDFALRWGVLEESLEVSWEGTYIWDRTTYNNTASPYTQNQSNFYAHSLGVKYLIFEPKKREANLYSWRDDHTAFHLKDLIPSISAYLGTDLLFGGNPFYPGESGLAMKAMIITQSHFAGRWVLNTNIMFDRVGWEDPMFSYILTLTHSLRDARYSVFAEHQGYKSDAYSDGVFRLGAARLINSNLQVDASAGINIKDTPSRLFAGLGVSYRLDYHINELVPLPIEEEETKEGLEQEQEDPEKLEELEEFDHKAGKKVRKRKKKDRKKNKKKRRRKKKNPFDIDNTL
ncbi:transporter [Sinomicrobium weinanense]|uniref:Transporter n=1 Tax=Sinomicrobium weinanense TaxID=2842200 RepID=A0A926JQJ7_9FLAO|nr:transporter [Sinomicrobium weinanense]MBC9795645.1 transporter [Sinomicrobium weinanense]MBU3122814.1 transporter [Sinomicrobium weinanense]